MIGMVFSFMQRVLRTNSNNKASLACNPDNIQTQEKTMRKQLSAEIVNTVRENTSIKPTCEWNAKARFIVGLPVKERRISGLGSRAGEPDGYIAEGGVLYKNAPASTDPCPMGTKRRPLLKRVDGGVKAFGQFAPVLKPETLRKDGNGWSITTGDGDTRKL